MRRGRYKKAQIQPKYRVNNQITASEVRLLGEDNKQIGIVSIDQAKINSHQSGLDLVEIAPKAKPPVVKIIDYKKFQYQEAKKLSQQKKTTKKIEQKEIRLKPFMADGDYQVKLKKIKKFIKEGHQVRISIPFHGRQLAHKNFGYELVARVIKDLGETAKIDQEPKFIGRKVLATISPKKKK